MADNIEWRAPDLAPHSPPGTWDMRLRPVMGRPSVWAMVKTCPTKATAYSNVSSLRRGTFRVPPGKWEFRAAGCEVFARYIGPE